MQPKRPGSAVQTSPASTPPFGFGESSKQIYGRACFAPLERSLPGYPGFIGAPAQQVRSNPATRLPPTASRRTLARCHAGGKHLLITRVTQKSSSRNHMPEEIEIDTESLRKEIDEEMEKSRGSMLRWISLTTALLAALAAIASLKAGATVNEALVLKTEATN